MVRLTADYIARCNGHTKRKRDEPTNHYLKRITHLYMAERNIEAIDNLSLCRNLTVLYLYDNKLNKTMNLGTAQNLTHLYLQNNNIRKIEGLKYLQKLTKLYLGYNDLSIIEGLESLELLKELHVEYQRLPSGEKLLFDPRTVLRLAKCLKCLNISGNHMDSLKELQPLTELSQLQACDNEIVVFENMRMPLMSWRQLSKLDLTGNPLCHKAKYRDKIIVMSHSLESLDGREISRLERQFLVSWNASREARRRMKLESQKNGFNDEAMDLPPLHKLGHIPTPPPHYMMGGLPGGRKRFEAILAKSRSLPNSAPVKQSFSKRRPPYTTPAPPMNSVLMEQDPGEDMEERRESEMLGKKSISDLTDNRRLERKMTPHPHTRRQVVPNGYSPSAPNSSPFHSGNGVLMDHMGSGDILEAGKPTLPTRSGSDVNGSHKPSYPSLRGSKKTQRTPFNGAIVSDSMFQGSRGTDGFDNDLMSPGLQGKTHEKQEALRVSNGQLNGNHANKE
ncbi:protein phosphatase 1 regulatory subunit 42-like [Clavelina lepadiformis]|uniref:protein phosphatase 1 regulatory subunit 42-like n=1 Tax=Clavelina lepadiformis TaxID=159417 RepID=UPI0040425258